MDLERVGGIEDGQGNGSKVETTADVKIAGRIATGGHCRLQRNVPHEL